MTLEQRVQRLEDIEAINFLMGTYYRAVDTKDHPLLRSTFADDAKAEYSDGKLCFNSGDEIVEKLGGMMPLEHLTMHTGHTPEITLTSETTAKAHWYLHDNLVLTDYDIGITGGAIYSIEYKKVGDKWLISYISYKRTYEERWSRKTPEKRDVTANMFAKA